MEFRLLEESDKRYYRGDLINLLIESDNDFVPPLSKRNSPRDMSFSVDSEKSDGISSYYDSMSSGRILAAISCGRVVGFVAFWENYEGGATPNIYVSTLVVAKSARGNGLTAKMYDYLFNELYSDRAVYTRTWSTNFAHTKILQRFGFAEFKRIKDDRGEGIDTVYFERKITE